jgi:D-glycero-alpha-D-manno-heptose-7-phosphate kinase
VKEGRREMIITRTPLRIPIGGGGTDLPFYYSRYGCSLVTAAIDKYIYIVIKPRFHHQTRVCYSKIEEVDDNAQIEHPLVREALKLLNIKDHLEIVSISDVSAGTGMGSSFSFLVGLLNALHIYKGEYVSKTLLAEEATKIDLDILKEPAGKQDQYIAAIGGIQHMLINRQGLVKMEPLNINDETVRTLESNLLLFYTGQTHSTAKMLSQQKKEAESDQAKMDNLTKIKEIGEEIRKSIEKGNTRRFGEWMNVHWELKRSLAKGMSNPQIDRLYKLALDNGAIGGKLMGSGGGGYLMFYCDNAHDQLRRAMAKEGLREMKFRFDFDGSKVIFDQQNR